MSAKWINASALFFVAATGCLYPLFAAGFFAVESPGWVWRTCAVLGVGCAVLAWLCAILAAVARDGAQE